MTHILVFEELKNISNEDFGKIKTIIAKMVLYLFTEGDINIDAQKLIDMLSEIWKGSESAISGGKPKNNKFQRKKSSTKKRKTTTKKSSKKNSNKKTSKYKIF